MQTRQDNGFASGAGTQSTERRVRKKTRTVSPELRLRPDGRLQMLTSGDWKYVNPVRCFPWSESGRFISLRDDDNLELHLIEDVQELGADARFALLRALEVSGFFLEIVTVESIEEDFEIRVWKVHTRRGPRSFQTELDAWPHPSPGGGHLISDVAGDVFLIPPLESLDRTSRRHLWPYVG